MIRDSASALAIPRATPARRIARSTRRALTAWRTITRTHVWSALCVGAIGGLLFLVTHSMHAILNLLSHQGALGPTIWVCTVAMVISVIVALLFLLAVRVAEYGDHGQPRAWLRYVVATLVATGASTALVHLLSPIVPVTGLVGWYPLANQVSVDSFIFSNWLLFGGLVVFVYVRLRRVRREQAAFEHAELERAATGRQVLRAQLAAMQAQVEPKFLFNTLGQIAALYKCDADGADRMLDDLIAYLRAALPHLRGETSTLAREIALAEAYLRIVQARMGSRLEFSFDVAPELGAASFPPMLLLPLIDNAARHGLEPLPLGGRIEVRAAARDKRLLLALSDTGLGDATRLQEGPGLSALRERLAGLYGHEATLRFGTTQPHGVTATIEVPHEYSSDHR